MSEITCFLGDCLYEMDKIGNSSVDMILTDLPYGTTQNSWDSNIDLKRLWKQYLRIIKENGCIALFAQAPFDKVLACSNLSMFRYEWIIHKTRATGHLNAKRAPLKGHENVLIFYKKLPTYNPQMTYGHSPVHTYMKHGGDGSCYGATRPGVKGGGSTSRYPVDILSFKWDTQKSSLHPTQKPIAMLEYFIKTYTNEGDVVLDSCMGSGSTGIACKNTNRKFIGIEMDKNYFNVAMHRFSQLEGR